jgi:hypothetical protein
MKYFTGIDVSLRFVSICVVDEVGGLQYEAKVPAEVELIVAAAILALLSTMAVPLTRYRVQRDKERDLRLARGACGGRVRRSPTRRRPGWTRGTGCWTCGGRVSPGRSWRRSSTSAGVPGLRR